MKEWKKSMIFYKSCWFKPCRNSFKVSAVFLPFEQSTSWYWFIIIGGRKFSSEYFIRWDWDGTWVRIYGCLRTLTTTLSEHFSKFSSQATVKHPEIFSFFQLLLFVPETICWDEVLCKSSNNILCYCPHNCLNIGLQT